MSDKTPPGVSTRHSLQSTPLSSPVVSLHEPGTLRVKLPHRPGIFWQVGQRLEAMDFQQQWYAAKIVEVLEQTQEIRIHFEGWNQRYDEVISMSSERLRARARHSGRQEKRKQTWTDHKVNDHVLARWTDCKMYPARISRIRTDGCFEVVFFDGVKKIVQPASIRELPEDMKNKRFFVKPSALPNKAAKTSKVGTVILSPSKKEEKSVDAKKVVHRIDRSSPGKCSAKQIRRLRVESSKPGKNPHRLHGKRHVNSKKKDIMEHSRLDRDRRRMNKRGKLIIAGSLFAKRNRLQKKSSQEVGESIDEPTATLTPSGRESQTPETSIPEVREPEVKSETSHPNSVPADQIEQTTPVPASPAQTSPPDAVPVPLPNLPLPEQMVLTTDLNQAKDPDKTKEAVKPRGRGKRMRKRTMSMPSVPMPSLAEDGTHQPSANSALSSQVRRFSDKGPSAPKAFAVEQDHNLFKCVFEGCQKSFRKENLLQSHIRHYHSEQPSSPTSPPPSAHKREKTLSICSTDSDISVSSRGKGRVGRRGLGKGRRRRQRRISALSHHTDSPDGVCDLLDEDEWGHRTSVSAAEESMEVEEDYSQEVVNCVCGLTEEEDLMIQCDVCKCWQHTACRNLTADNLPKKYICHVCENPPGVRDSCRFLHDQEWFRAGRLPCFPFLKTEVSECEAIKKTHDLMSDVLSIQSVLHSLRLQLKALKDKDEIELLKWQNVRLNFSTADSIPRFGTHEQTAGLASSRLPTKSETITCSVDSLSATSILDLPGLENVDILALEPEAEATSEDSGEMPSILEESVPVLGSSPQEICSELEARVDPGLGEIISQGATSDESSLTMSSQSSPNLAAFKNSLESVQKTSQDIPPSPVSALQFAEQDSSLSPQSVLLVSSSQQSTSEADSVLSAQLPSEAVSVLTSESPLPALEKAEESRLLDNSDTQSSLLTLEVVSEEAAVEAVSTLMTEEERRQQLLEICRWNLLHHIQCLEQQMEARLDAIDQKLTVMEEAESAGKPPAVLLSEVPILKSSMRTLNHDLYKVKRISAYH